MRLAAISWRVALAALVASAVLGGTAAGASGSGGGQATVVAPSGGGLTHGGSATPFSLDLSSPAECPGDTANQEYIVTTFMVAAGRDPGDLTYDGLGPTPTTWDDARSFLQPLYAVDTSGVVSLATDEAEDKVGPGPITSLPPMSLGVYTVADLPPGRYDVGVVCLRSLEVQRAWTATLDVKADRSDPAGFSWTVDGAAEAGSSSSTAIWLLVIAAAVAIVVVVLRRRSPRRGPPSPPTEAVPVPARSS